MPRIYPDEDGHLSFAECDYGLDKNGEWYARPPGMHMGSLKNHEVKEHGDGTITVSPSILISPEDTHDGRSWHGHLIRGEWKPVDGYPSTPLGSS